MDSSAPIANKVLPSKESTLPFWRTELHELDTHRSTADLPSACDILIIGAGYAGITAAYHLLNNFDGAKTRPNIVLVEARQACSGATARNGLPHLTLLPAHQVTTSNQVSQVDISDRQSLTSFHPTSNSTA